MDEMQTRDTSLLFRNLQCVVSVANHIGWVENGDCGKGLKSRPLTGY